MNIVFAALFAAVGLSAGSSAQNQKMPAHGPKIQRTPSGLEYSVLRDTEATRQPKRGDKVRFHYSGWLKDGTLFETSRRGEAREVILGVAMPKVWTEGLALMTTGAVFKVVAPPDLGFGSTGAPGKPPDVPSVPPDATLVFELELVSFESGIDLPPFVLPDVKKQKTTASGLKYELIEQGEGEQPAEGERFEVEFTLFNGRAQLIATSLLPTERAILGRHGRKLQGPQFLSEAIGMLRLGGSMRFEVPPALCYGELNKGHLLPPGSTTFWLMKLARLDPAPAPRELPEFRRLDRTKARRTKSGIRYEVIEPGVGETPKARDSVEFHYAGWLSNGKLFDDSMAKGLPLSVRMSEVISGVRGRMSVIPGLVEGLQLMRPGAVFRFIVPPSLAFGLRGNKKLGIGPNRMVYFHVELITVETGQR